jgi:hypothetical protein
MILYQAEGLLDYVVHVNMCVSPSMLSTSPLSLFGLLVIVTNCTIIWYGTQNVKTHNRTTQKTKKMSKRNYPTNQRVNSDTREG